ncbi:MAG: cytochrome P450 [Bacteroidota bacterium]
MPTTPPQPAPIRAGSPPGPQGWGFVRLLPQLTRDPLGAFTHIARTYGPLVYLHLGDVETYLVNHPDLVRHVLRDRATTYTRGKLLDDLRPLIGQGLFTSEGDLWKQQRRLVGHAFRTEYDAAVGAALRTELDALLSTWQDGEVVDVQAAMKRLLLRVMTRTMFAPAWQIDADAMIADLDIVLQHASLANNFLRRVWNGTPGLRRLRPPGTARATAALARIDTITYDVIERATLHDTPNGDDPRALAPAPLLRLLLDAEAQGMLDRKQIRDELNTFLFAGFDTTAGALSTAWMSLGTHANVRARMDAELDAALGDRTPTLADLRALPYTEAVLHETLRLYPPAWAYHRIALEDDVMPDGSDTDDGETDDSETDDGETDDGAGWHVPTRAHVMLCPYALHRHPDFWDRPDAFDPTRFLKADGTPDAFVGLHYAPFGFGRHICIGRRHALLQAHLVLATLGQRLHLDPTWSEPPRLDAGIILKAKGGLPMRVAVRR